ncbi:MAG: RNA polymerase sigma-70 factor (ECF subfamily) [Planctomycetota bacterium]|jgi:RNA polymerase sigma-70 factor (ECF subfamily)
MPTNNAGDPALPMSSTRVTDSQLDPERWVNEHGDYLLNNALLRLRDRTKAEDAVQDTLVTALHARASFRGDSSVRTWLTGILKNKVLEALRKQSRESAHRQSPPTDEDVFEPDQDFDERGHLRPESMPSPFSLSPSDSLEKQEFYVALRECLDELPERVGQAFASVEIDQRPADDVADDLQLKRNNLYVLLHRARKKLRACLERNWFGDLCGKSPSTPERRDS